MQDFIEGPSAWISRREFQQQLLNSASRVLPVLEAIATGMPLPPEMTQLPDSRLLQQILQQATRVAVETEDPIHLQMAGTDATPEARLSRLFELLDEQKITLQQAQSYIRLMQERSSLEDRRRLLDQLGKATEAYHMGIDPMALLTANPTPAPTPTPTPTPTPHDVTDFK